MGRKTIKILTGPHGKVVFYVDSQCISNIIEYLLQPENFKEFRIIVELLFENKRNAEKYCKADVSYKAHEMFEMRFTSKMKNDRIYCKEIHISGKRSIILADLFIGKSTQKISKEQKKRITMIGGYEYEI